MKKLPIVVFLLIALTAISSSVCSYRCTEQLIHQDVSQALEKTLVKMSGDVVTADTICCYRAHITIAEVRDTASITVTTERRNNRYIQKLTAEPNCAMPVVFMLSDQRASASLLFLGLLWLLASSIYLRKNQSLLLQQELAYGGLFLRDGIITTHLGSPIHLTPMQHELLEMFLSSESHTLTKQEICNRLWPKKPDAHDTLYTLIRRTRPILEAHTNLTFESDRGKSYSLVIK